MNPTSTAALLAFFGAAALGSLAGCSKGPEAAVGADAVPAVDPAFRGRLEAAKGYEAMGRVDDLARWAPAMCAAPPPPAARFSASADEATHGGKLFTLYAKDRDAYVDLAGKRGAHAGIPTDVPGLEDCSQVVVKEAFAPLPWAAAEGKRGSGHREQDVRGLAPAAKDGKKYATGEPRGLFVMFRVDAKPASTDDGWVYGTVAPDGTVTGCGKMASCMACHAKVPHGRLFGLPEKVD